MSWHDARHIERKLFMVQDMQVEWMDARNGCHSIPAILFIHKKQQTAARWLFLSWRNLFSYLSGDDADSPSDAEGFVISCAIRSITGYLKSSLYYVNWVAALQYYSGRKVRMMEEVWAEDSWVK